MNSLYSSLTTSDVSPSSIERSDSSPPPSDVVDPFRNLKSLRLENINRLVIASININSLRGKFESLKTWVKSNIDIIVITETKLDESFPVQQFVVEGYRPSFRQDRDRLGGGVMIIVREDIPCREICTIDNEVNIEGIFLEFSTRKQKWLLLGGYCNKKSNINTFLSNLGSSLDIHLSRYDNLLLLGDFNSEITEPAMKDFCETYNLKNLIDEPTCFKNPNNPSSIDLMLTNKYRSVQHNHTIETGLSDHHKMTVCFMRSYFPKQAPTLIRYRNFKKFDNSAFRTELFNNLNNYG